MMKLCEILLKSDELGEYDVVYAIKPWSLDAEARVVNFGVNDAVPRILKGSSFEYFLEAPTIKEIHAQVLSGGGTETQMLHILLYYAENDAFPN